MADTTALDALRDTLMGLPSTTIGPPRQPVHAMLDSGRSMLDLARTDERGDALAHVGFAKKKLDDVERSLDALDLSQRRWRALYDRRVYTDALQGEIEQGYDARARALRAADYNLEGNTKAEAILSNVRDGEGHGDMIEDLHVLAQMFRDNKKAFKEDRSVDVDALSTDLDARADRLSEGLARAKGGDQVAYDEAIDLRDRAATHAYEQLRHLRRAGRYAFHDDPRARDMFANTYERDIKRAQRADVQDDRDTRSDDGPPSTDTL